MIVISKYQDYTTTSELIKWVSIPKSSYYYKPTDNRPGIPKSTTTVKNDGEVVTNKEVVEEIKKILDDEFVCYGYQNVTAVLKNQGYFINHKKVYRLMDESHLLLGKVIRTQSHREWVKFRKINAAYPLEYLCWDIKYV